MFVSMNIDSIYEIYRSCGCRVATDSRNIKGGELFFALKGEKFDGNAYVLKALEAGAAYAVAEEDSEFLAPELVAGLESRIIRVHGTAETLRALARHHRETLGLPVVGLTGTNGKTTTKELVNAVLSSRYRTWATQGNLNNNIGVPLTVLSIPEDAQIAIVEMGASHPGDIKELVDICEPDFGLITNVGKAHLLGFGSFEGVKATKGELYDFIAERALSCSQAVRTGVNGVVSGRDCGRIFLNCDNADLCSMAAERGFTAGKNAIAYGLNYSSASVLPTDAQHPFLGLRLSDGTEVHTNLVGAYNADNVLAALCVGEYFGVPLQDAVAAIDAYQPSNNRSQMVRTERNILIVDAYNANPTSMAAALDNFSSFAAEKKIVLLGNMLELGEASLEEHRKIAAKAGTFKAYYVGDEFAKAGAAPCFSSSEELAAYITAHKKDFTDAAILIKGSRGTRMERTMEVL